MNQNHSSSSSSPPIISSSLNSEESEIPNWLDLPSDITAMILLKLGTLDILNNAQLVCTQWRCITKDPDLWRVIDMSSSFDTYGAGKQFDLKKMCSHAIDRSQGNLIAISLSHFGSDDLLHYIADFASHLQRLCLVCCYAVSYKGLSEVVKKLPCLEELDLSIGHLSVDSLEAIGRCCPLLKSLNINTLSQGFGDDVAFAIAQTMPNLHHLQLVRIGLTNEGLLAILDGCPRLESLHLRKCFNVDLGGNLGRRCAEQIKDLVLLGDSFDGYRFDYDYYPFDYDDYYDDYPFDYDDYPYEEWFDGY